MGRFKEIRQRIPTRKEASRVPTMRLPDEVTSSEARTERLGYYSSQRWRDLRAKMLSTSCRRCMFCGDMTPAEVLEHVVGHGSDAAAVAAVLGLPPVDPDWRVRFWKGPFAGSCQHHARQRSGYERSGRLLKWTRDWADIRRGIA